MVSPFCPILASDIFYHDISELLFHSFVEFLCVAGDNFLIWLGDQPQIVVTEPDLVKEILMDKEGVFRKVKPRDYAKRLLGDGLVVAEGEKWSKLRKLANFAFHGESLKVDYYSQLHQLILILVFVILYIDDEFTS